MVTQPDDRLAEHALIVSSDGHATAKMCDYRKYLDPSIREEFDAFCDRFDVEGMTTTNPESLAKRIDPELIADWIATVLDEGRVEGQWDPVKRLAELDHEGISGEVIFPDFGLPFELHPPLTAAIVGFASTPEQVEAANRAYNRWLVDFCGTSPERLFGLALVSFADIEDTVAEIRWAKEAGLKGIVLPALQEERPLFAAEFDPVWSALEDTEMVVATHVGISSITHHISAAMLQAVPHSACAAPIMTAQAFFNCQQILNHMIWGGVLERHPGLHLALTEQGTGWVVSALRGMDYSWERSHLRRDVRKIVKHRPSFYFDRQVHMGSSFFSRAEAAARSDIVVRKIMIGADYPHHEGNWGAGPGTTEYIQATLGAEHVPPQDARLMRGENAIETFHLNGPALRKTADDIGAALQVLLTPPTKDWFPVATSTSRWRPPSETVGDPCGNHPPLRRRVPACCGRSR
jgi:predicted TIM-barrel fold metal-dependent hydrolase